MKVPFSVRGVLDYYLSIVEEKREPDGKYHPSSFFNCLRQVIYGLRAVEETNPSDAQSQRRFWLGHMIHSGVQAAITYSPWVTAFYPEFEVDIPELNIVGHGDGLVFLTDGTVVVLELKSARASSFRYGKKEGHVQQASIYSLAARDYGVSVIDPETGEKIEIPPLGERLIGILLAYIEKEDADMAEYFIPFEETAWREAIEERVAEANAYRDDPSSLPPRLPTVKGRKPWQCNPKWCAWYDRCQKKDTAQGRQPAGQPAEVEPW